MVASKAARVALLCCAAGACGRSVGHHAARGQTPTVPGSGGVAGDVGEGGTGAAGAPSVDLHSGGMPAVEGEAGAGGAIDPSERSSVVLDGTPLYTRIPRLTASQWEHAVTDILRFAEPPAWSQSFAPSPPGSADFENNEKILFIDSTNFLDFETGAEAAAALATGSADALAALYDGTDAAGFVRALGRRAFRRPLSGDEEAAYGAVFARGEELYGEGFAQGAGLVIRALLESPHFLYRTELGPSGAALNGYEVASKLSFLLLDTTPSDALLDAAGAGELDSDQGLETAAREMLAAPAAVAVLRDFHRQLLALDRYATLDKRDVTDFDPAVLPELDAATAAFFDHVFQTNLGLREILTSKEAYVGPGLASLYGVAAPSSGLELRELDTSRSGYFMQVPFLMAWADGARSGPSQRGLRLQRMLCGPRPGDDPTTTTPPEQAGQTTRDYVTALTAGCGGTCHAAIDPLGFALESFDGLGRTRAEDNGQPVNTAGSYPFAEGVRQFNDGNDLVRIMADSMQVHTCYSKNVAGYALGRDMAPGDRQLLETLGQVSLSNSLKELVVALVRDPAFRSRPTEAP
jgi:hypothetical protein